MKPSLPIYRHGLLLITLLGFGLGFPEIVKATSTELANLWEKMDTSPSLTAQIGSSRLSKWLILEANPANATQRINRQLLGESLTRVFTTEQGQQCLSQDLQRGDVHLAEALAQVFASFNFPEQEVQSLLHSLAQGIKNETLQATIYSSLHREATLSVLEQYCLETPEDWGRSLEGLEAILQGTSPLPISLLEQGLEESDAFEEHHLDLILLKAQKNDLQAKWSLSQGLARLQQSQGALSRQLQSTPLKTLTLYQAIWLEVLREIEEDPLLREEYLSRLRKADPLAQEFQQLLAETLTEGCDPFINGLLPGAQTQPSRCRWIYDRIRASRPDWKGMELNSFINSADLRRQFAQELGQRIEHDRTWSNYLLWELTRPAEAATRALRLALPTCLGQDEEILRHLWSTYDLDRDFSPLIESYQLFAFYNGGEAEFRRHMEQGTIDPTALQQFGSGFGRLLAFSDRAWSRLISGKSFRNQQRLKICLQSAFRQDPETVFTWLETLRLNDRPLKESFAQWLIQERKLPDLDTFNHWIGSLSESLRDQKIIGNPDLANFKEWFVDYAQTDLGLEQVQRRVGLESFLIPEPLRESLAQTLQREPTRFWRLYGMLTSHEAVAKSSCGLTEELQNFASQSDLGSFLMEEVTARNHAANDAMEPAWEEILAPGSATIQAIQQTITKGSSVSDLYGIVALAMDQTLADSQLWPHFASTLISFYPDTDNAESARNNCHAQLFQQGAASNLLLNKLLTDEVILAAWQKRLLAAVNFLGKGYIIADFILHHHELQSEWSQSIAHAVAKDPLVAKTMITSLVQRRVGDANWNEQIAAMRYRLARLILENRVLVENLIAQPNAGFLSQLETIYPAMAKIS